MKNYKIIVFLILIIILITGCTKKDITKYSYTYTGSNDLWEAEYKVNCTVIFTEKKGKLDGETEGGYELIITYKGELSDLSSIKHLALSYQTSTSREEWVKNYGTDEFITSKIFKMSSDENTIGIPIENDIIEVTINLDGNIQTLELTNLDYINDAE